VRAFVVRPFGTRNGIDFDQVEHQLIGPALKNVGATGGTTGEIMEAGNIRIDMFQQLLAADLVVADISTNNPNVFYELGIRHSLQGKRTYLIRAKTRSPQVLAADAKKEEVPFDLKTDRYFEYDPTYPEKSVDRLSQALRQTIDSEKQDSPVFLLLPDLKPQDREHFLPVPLSFGEEVQKAQVENDPTRLTLLSFEVQGSAWESTGLRLAGRALLSINQTRVSRITWEILLKLDELDLEANINLGNIYQRLGDLTASDQALDRALRRANTPKDLAEVHGQMGRNKKDRWARAWSKENPPDQARLAIKSPWLVDAYEQYFAAYRQDLDSYYPGLNALALAVIVLELAARFPDVWNTNFGDDSEASQKLIDIKKKRDQLTSALQLRFESALAPDASAQDKQDKWLLSSAGDHSLLTLPNANRALFFYRKASETWGPFVLDSVARQLHLFRELGVMNEKVEQALASLPPGAASTGTSQIERVILFTGHRIDSAKRKVPRFPQSKEPIAKEAIRRALLEQKAITQGSLFGVAGGANGGDTLFLELCEELSIPTDMLLTLPDDQFVDASVVGDDPGWERRFYNQLQKHPNAPILAQSPELPKWLQFKNEYDIWQRNNLWLLSHALCKGANHFTLIALWDGEVGDGPGGTEHMVSMAKERGARVVHLNTKAIFGLG
jgi:tetratricopeptide (TPR) repeat protein